MKQLIQFVRLATFQSSLLINHTLTEQIHSNLHHSSTRTFSVTSLKEPKFTFLYGELHILHITIVIFQLSLQSIQFLINFRHSFFHRWILGSTLLFTDTSQLSPTL